MDVSHQGEGQRDIAWEVLSGKRLGRPVLAHAAPAPMLPSPQCGLEQRKKVPVCHTIMYASKHCNADAHSVTLTLERSDAPEPVTTAAVDRSMFGATFVTRSRSHLHGKCAFIHNCLSGRHAVAAGVYTSEMAFTSKTLPGCGCKAARRTARTWLLHHHAQLPTHMTCLNRRVSTMQYGPPYPLAPLPFAATRPPLPTPSPRPRP